MKKLLTVLFTLLISVQQAQAFSLDAFMDKNIAPVSDKIASLIFFPIHVLALMFQLLYFGFCLREYFSRSISEELLFGALNTPLTMYSDLKKVQILMKAEKFPLFRH